MGWKPCRVGFPLAGSCAALLVFASPVVGVDATSAYNDVALAAVAFTLFHLLQIWETDRRPALLWVIGLIAGFGFAVKYTAWIGVPYALGFVLWRSRKILDLARVAAPASLIAGVWLARNWMWVHNPVAPFFNNIFPNPYVSRAFEIGYKQELAMYTLQSRAQIPMQAFVRGGLQGLLGPVLLLAPLALLALRKSQGRQLLLAALVFGANYFSNIGTRFLIPPLPLVALAMMLALTAIPNLAVGIAVLHAVLSWPPIIARYSEPYAWRLWKVPYREALRIKSQSEYLSSHLIYNDEERMLETTPAGSTIFSDRKSVV